MFSLWTNCFIKAIPFFTIFNTTLVGSLQDCVQFGFASNGVLNIKSNFIEISIHLRRLHRFFFKAICNTCRDKHRDLVERNASWFREQIEQSSGDSFVAPTRLRRQVVAEG